MFGMKMSPIGKAKDGPTCGQTTPAIQKRRARPAAVAATPGSAAAAAVSAAEPRAGALAPSKAARIGEAIAALQPVSGATEARLKAVAELRRALSVEACPPVQAVIDQGGCAPLVACLGDSSPAVQFEAAWALTNIASGTTAQTLAILEAGAAGSMFRILASEQISDRAELCEQCLSALGNLAGDEDVRPRDQLLGVGVVGHLGSLFERIPGFSWDLHGRVQVLRSLTRLMSNLCGGQPAPPLEEVDCAFDYFAQVLLGTDDVQMLADALFGLACLLEGAAEEAGAAARAERLLSAGFAAGAAPAPHPVLLKVVDCSRRGGGAAPSALRLLGALASAPGEQPTDALFSAGALQALRSALVDIQAAPQARCDAAWALANVAAGTPAQAQRLLDARAVLDALCGVLEKGGEAAAKQECAWAAVHLARRGPQALAQADARRLLSALAPALRGEGDAPLLCALLEAAAALLRLGEEQAAAKGLTASALAAHAEECGLVQELERLQRGKADAVQRRAARALEVLSRASADRENEPPQERTPKKDKSRAPSAICGGSPIRPAAYKFGA